MPLTANKKDLPDTANVVTTNKADTPEGHVDLYEDLEDFSKLKGNSV